MFGIFKRFKVGLSLLRSSGRVLWQHPKLTLFPVLSAISSLAFMIALFGGIAFTGLFESDLIALGALFLFYAGTTFIASFFNAALMYCAARAFNGDEPRLTEGMAVAWDNKGLLAAWATIAAIVGLVLRAIEESSDILGKIVRLIVGTAWAVMTFFVVPVIVFEDVSVFGMFSRSTSLIRETWGESFAARGALGVIIFFTVLVGVVAGFVFPLSLAGIAPSWLGLFAGFIPILVFGLGAYFVGSALAGIAKAALYVYASQGIVTDEFRNLDGVLG